MGQQSDLAEGTNHRAGRGEALTAQSCASASSLLPFAPCRAAFPAPPPPAAGANIRTRQRGTGTSVAVLGRVRMRSTRVCVFASLCVCVCVCQNVWTLRTRGGGGVAPLRPRLWETFRPGKASSGSLKEPIFSSLLPLLRLHHLRPSLSSLGPRSLFASFSLSACLKTQTHKLN